MGVLSTLMQLSNIKILSTLNSLKSKIIKTGIFVTLAAYWSVILVGTFITFH